MSKWKVSSNYIGGKYVYQVYRILDVDDVDHAGNREYKPGLYDSEDVAQKVADALNRWEWR